MIYISSWLLAGIYLFHDVVVGSCSTDVKKKKVLTSGVSLEMLTEVKIQ